MWGKPDTVTNEAPKNSGWGGALWSKKSSADVKSKGAFRGEKYFLSNMYNCSVEYQGVTYSSSELAFQVQKCADEAERQHLIELDNPFEVKKAAYKVKKREDWQEVKVGIMRDIVTAKFTQNPDLAQKLLETGNELLQEENSWNDKFWGTVNGEGENHLGKILMEVRDRLREAVSEFGGLPAQVNDDVSAEMPSQTKQETPQSVFVPEVVTVPSEPEKPVAKPSGGSQKKWNKNPESQAVINAIAKGRDIDEETFHKMKMICMNIVKGIEYYSFSKFKPAEYKYFTELVELYQRFEGKALSKEDAKVAEKTMLKEYQEYKETEKKWWDGIKRWNEAIKVSEMNRSTINKLTDSEEDMKTALDLCLQTVALMTRDSPFLDKNRKKYLGDRPLAVSYDKEDKSIKRPAIVGE